MTINLDDQTRTRDRREILKM